jgi:hypothetical protein
LFAGSTGDDQFTRGKQEGCSFRFIDTDGDGGKSLFVVGTVWDTSRNHIEVDFVVVGLNVNGGHHVVSRRRTIIFVFTEFLTYVFVVQTMQQTTQAFLCGQLLVSHK